MTQLIWDDSFSVGVPELDRHHQRLAELINELAASQDKPAHSEEIVDILSALSDYANYHFAHEEHLMGVHGYPDLADHLSEHNVFCEMVANACYQATCSALDLPALLAYLCTWWEDHILRVDIKYKPFLAPQNRP